MSDIYKNQFINQYGSLADEFTNVDGIGNPVFYLVSFPRIILFILVLTTFVMYRKMSETSNSRNPNSQQASQNRNLFYLSLGLTIAALVWVIWITGWVEIPQTQKWRAKLFANDKALGMWEKYNNARHQEEVERQLSEIRDDIYYDRGYRRDRTYDEGDLAADVTGSLLNAALR